MDLTGKTVVLTGTFPIPRAEAEAALTALGAKISGSLSKKTDILFVGTDAGSKLNKAQALQVPIRDSADLMALIHSTPAPFWQTPLQGTEPDFLARLQALPWENFSPERDLLPLRAALLQSEVLTGINEAHRFASEKLQKRLSLAHPYVHRVELSAFALSPDGRHLAVGSWVGDDYDAGGFLQIWDIELGRCVNSIPIRGGVGWPDYGRCIQWRRQPQPLEQ